MENTLKIISSYGLEQLSEVENKLTGNIKENEKKKVEFYKSKGLTKTGKLRKVRHIIKKERDLTCACIGRTSNGDQCSRTKSENELLCKCHQKNCCYGTINERPPRFYYEQIAKKKNCAFFENIDQETLDTQIKLDENYLRMRFALIEGIEYLIDEENKLYRFVKLGKPKLYKVGYINDQGDLVFTSITN